MKKTLREKNTIIITFIFYLILLIIIGVSINIYFLDKINEIEEKKLETQKIYEDYKKIKKEGISYDEFTKLLAGNNDRIIKDLDKNFYDKYLKNTKEKDFNSFLDKKIKELNTEENIELIKKNKLQIESILPIYGSLNIKEKNLTDLKFINYIESIAESFNLSLNGSIGISRSILLDEYAISNKDGSLFESSIFYIPIDFNIKGSKSNIIDFLYFIENVGNINVYNNKLNIFTDKKFLSVNGIPKVLSGDKYKRNYNIFEHQIADISSINIPKYIDDSYVFRKKQDFIDFIKRGQGNEDFEVKVKLRFYIKGQPKYEIVDFIKKVVDNYNLLKNHINKLVSSGKVKGASLIRLKKKQKLLKNLSKNISALNNKGKIKNSLDSIYKKAIDLENILEPICDEFTGICKK